VAKRFFHLDDEPGTHDDVDIKESNIQIQAELSRLAIGQWFLTAFFEDAKGKGVMVDTSMFQSCFSPMVNLIMLQVLCLLMPS
jgi:hypothetical protein